MNTLILHHFDASPFAEKIRLALGLKGLAWHSVEIPMVMPKPDLTALTGGYRKTPVMQIGADIYCDTQCIAMELERRFPENGTLFPGQSQGLCLVLAQWSDKAFFQPGAGLSMATNKDLPEPILADRRAFFNFLDFSRIESDLPHFQSQFIAQLHLVEAMLSSGRRFLLGDHCAWADILAYFPVWMARTNIADSSEWIARYPLLERWEERVSALGHGSRSDMQAQEALSIASESESASRELVSDGAIPVLWAGAAVTVTPDDYGAVPVEGELVRLTEEDIAIRRTDPRAGEVVVHFPRVGFRVEKT